MNKTSLAEFLKQNPKLQTHFKDDIYFQNFYAKLYGEVFEFEFKKDNFYFKTIAIKEKIPNTSFYDLQSPYGYSGFYSNTNDLTFLKQALEKLKEKALKENIIAFFIRFHPFDFICTTLKPQLHFFTKNKSIIVVATHEELQNIRLHYSPRIRSYVKKARKELKIEFCTQNEATAFKQLYDKTMQRNNANDFYFFNQDYFEKLFSFKESLIIKASLNGEILAYASFLLCQNLAYYHLSANKLKANANAALLDFFFEYAHQKGIHFCLLGGGVKDDDTLFKFKEKFSNIHADFNIGGIIFNEQIYNSLCQNHHNNTFLKYRFN
ncbi:hypothetical protein [Campylobacter sp. CCS1377]|uniref:FemAB family protein n=1 Tax=Campylobacter sp. CCS1377 TaxID=3158229 RepID=A0AAU7E853_9BACT